MYFNHTLGTTVPAENFVMDCKIEGEQFKMTMELALILKRTICWPCWEQIVRSTVPII